MNNHDTHDCRACRNLIINIIQDNGYYISKSFRSVYCFAGVIASSGRVKNFEVHVIIIMLQMKRIRTGTRTSVGQEIVV